MATKSERLTVLSEAEQFTLLLYDCTVLTLPLCSIAKVIYGHLGKYDLNSNSANTSLDQVDSSIVPQ